MKRQLTSFTCPKCNCTFDNEYRMKNHMKEQHEGKHNLSPERKATKQFQEEVVNTKINLDGETITIPRQEQEHLHDMLVTVVSGPIWTNLVTIRNVIFFS